MFGTRCMAGQRWFSHRSEVHILAAQGASCGVFITLSPWNPVLVFVCLQPCIIKYAAATHCDKTDTYNFNRQRHTSGLSSIFEFCKWRIFNLVARRVEKSVLPWCFARLFSTIFSYQNKPTIIGNFLLDKCESIPIFTCRFYFGGRKIHFQDFPRPPFENQDFSRSGRGWFKFKTFHDFTRPVRTLYEHPSFFMLIIYMHCISFSKHSWIQSSTRLFMISCDKMQLNTCFHLDKCSYCDPWTLKTF